MQRLHVRSKKKKLMFLSISAGGHLKTRMLEKKKKERENRQLAVLIIHASSVRLFLSGIPLLLFYSLLLWWWLLLLRTDAVFIMILVSPTLFVSKMKYTVCRPDFEIV